jgi:glutaredoxin
MRGRPQNAERQLAVELGFPTYIGLAHARCGTVERYTKGGGCVHCARVIATEQREARRFLKHHEQEYRESVPEEEIDVDREESFGIDDAEARRQAALDELM